MGAIVCTVDLKKNDSEITILFGCTDEEKSKVSNFINLYDSMKGIIIERQG